MIAEVTSARSAGNQFALSRSVRGTPRSSAAAAEPSKLEFEGAAVLAVVRERRAGRDDDGTIPVHVRFRADGEQIPPNKPPNESGVALWRPPPDEVRPDPGTLIAAVLELDPSLDRQALPSGKPWYRVRPGSARRPSEFPADTPPVAEPPVAAEPQPAPAPAAAAVPRPAAAPAEPRRGEEFRSVGAAISRGLAPAAVRKGVAIDEASLRHLLATLAACRGTLLPSNWWPGMLAEGLDLPLVTATVEARWLSAGDLWGAGLAEAVRQAEDRDPAAGPVLLALEGIDRTPCGGWADQLIAVLEGRAAAMAIPSGGGRIEVPWPENLRLLVVCRDGPDCYGAEDFAPHLACPVPPWPIPAGPAARADDVPGGHLGPTVWAPLAAVRDEVAAGRPAQSGEVTALARALWDLKVTRPDETARHLRREWPVRRLCRSAPLTPD